jgi:hypothetical protein
MTDTTTTTPSFAPNPKFKQATKNFWELKHIKSVSAYAVLLDGKPAGKILFHWSDNPAGATVTAAVAIFDGPLSDLPMTTGTAGGLGYDKQSAAIYAALTKAAADPSEIPAFHGSGMVAVIEWLQTLGYTVFQVL